MVWLHLHFSIYLYWNGQWSRSTWLGILLESPKLLSSKDVFFLHFLFSSILHKGVANLTNKKNHHYNKSIPLLPRHTADFWYKNILFIFFIFSILWVLIDIVQARSNYSYPISNNFSWKLLLQYFQFLPSPQNFIWTIIIFIPSYHTVIIQLYLGSPRKLYFRQQICYIPLTRFAWFISLFSLPWFEDNSTN